MPLIPIYFNSSSSNTAASFTQSMHSLLTTPSAIPLSSLQITVPFCSLNLLMILLALCIVFCGFLLISPNIFTAPMIAPHVASILPPMPTANPCVRFLTVSSSNLPVHNTYMPQPAHSYNHTFFFELPLLLLIPSFSFLFFL